MKLRACAVVCLIATLAVPAMGQQKKPSPKTSPSAAPSAQAQAQAQYPENLYNGLQWRLVGPFRGGRVLAVAGDPKSPHTYYFGAVAGGVWKSTDDGTTWAPISDKYPFWSVGAIAVAPSSPNVIYAGTGEACIRGDITYGNGVWKSTDSGKTWQHIGLEDTRQIGRVMVNPANPDIVFVAALGHAFGPNPERGVFRSTDGGKTWQKVLYKDENTGAIDLSLDPNDPNTIYATLYQAYRKPWEMVSGGPGSGLYKSTDGGTTWKQLTGNGLPKGVLGRIGVAVSPADSERVYAIIEAEQGGVYRSNDGGEHWTRTNSESRFTQRAWYYAHIFADPKDANALYVLNTGLYRSTDAGKTWTVLRAPHGDHHALWIDPENPQRMINGNDGGATVSEDGGKTWSSVFNQPTAQFYHVAADNRFRYYLYGAQQDNSTVAIASSTDGGSIDRTDWYPVGGGESGFVVPYPPNPNIVFAGSYDGLITRYNKDTAEMQDVNPWPDNPMGWGAADLKYRFQWTAPIALSPHDPNVLYHGANVLFRSTDMGQSWTAISPDLTRNDKSKQGPSGGPITKDNTSVEYFGTIFAVAESPVAKGEIWAGSDDGLVHITRDAGAHWENVTPKEMPEWGTVSLIDASPRDAGTAFVAVDRHRLDDLAPYIFKTTDYGKTWTKIVSGIPAGSFVHAVRQDPQQPNMLYAGTETGVFISWDDGARWQPLKLNLPEVPIHDLLVKGNDLAIATHGRSFWVLDNIQPLRELSPQVAASDVFFYQPAAAFRSRGSRGFGGPPSPAPTAGRNPAGPVVLDYFLKTVPQGEAALEILDAQGKLVRKYSSKEAPKKRRAAPAESEFEEFQPAAQPRLPVKAGENRFVWDLRYEAPVNIPGLAQWGGRPRGPLAAPGNYEARLTVAGKQYRVPLEVKADPRVKATTADYAKEFELASAIARRVDDANRAVNQMVDVLAQIDSLHEKYDTNAAAKDVLAQADALKKKITPVEEEIAQTKSHASEDPLNFPIRVNNKLLLLQQTVESAEGAPTAQSSAVFDLLSKQLDAALAQWKQIASADVPALNAAIQKASLPAITVDTGAE
jgi:photosystem II stability/assembly factor-like uncharacterized protein